MNNNLEDDLQHQNDDWKPNSQQLDSMLSKAHQQAGSIKTNRRIGAGALALCMGLGLIFFTQSNTLSQQEETPPTIIATNTETPVNKTTSNQPEVDSPYSQEEQESMEAIVEASFYKAEDFDFIEDSLGVDWDQLLAEY